MSRIQAQVLFAVLTLSFLGGGLFFAVKAWDRFDLRARMRAEAVETTGTVLDSGQYLATVTAARGSTRNETRYGVVLRFATASGQEVEQFFPIADRRDLIRYPEGAGVPVRYLPDAPAHAEIAPDTLGEGRWFSVLMAAILGGVGLWLLSFLRDVLRAGHATR